MKLPTAGAISRLMGIILVAAIVAMDIMIVWFCVQHLSFSVGFNIGVILLANIYAGLRTMSLKNVK